MNALAFERALQPALSPYSIGIWAKWHNAANNIGSTPAKKPLRLRIPRSDAPLQIFKHDRDRR
jgi:hypothetical protein